MDLFFPSPHVDIIQPEYLTPTFRTLEHLLEHTPAQITQYFAMAEAQYGTIWIKYFLWHIHDQPKYKDPHLMNILSSSENKPAAFYLARIFVAYFCCINKLRPPHTGYEKLTNYFPHNQTLQIISLGKSYTFRPS